MWEKELKKANIIKKRKDLFNPVINIKAGRYILGKLYVQYSGDMDKVLKHYSGGAKNYKEKVYAAME